jgi:hypothetical protein
MPKPIRPSPGCLGLFRSLNLAHFITFFCLLPLAEENPHHILCPYYETDLASLLPFLYLFLKLILPLLDAAFLFSARHVASIYSTSLPPWSLFQPLPNSLFLIPPSPSFLFVFFCLLLGGAFLFLDCFNACFPFPVSFIPVDLSHAFPQKTAAYVKLGQFLTNGGVLAYLRSM